MKESSMVNERERVTISENAYHVVKRAFDLICASIGCLFLVPILIIVKIAYICTGDFDSIFLPQERIGLNGKTFKFYKIRTMVVGADEILYKLLEQSDRLREEYEENKKLKNDPRITKVGRILRRLSIDELPQLINILKGDMSFIGNRPYLPREKEDMGLYFKTIVKTKPGLTGYWQTHGRSDVSFRKRLELESYYSNNCNLKMDIKIFFQTFKVVLGKDGAK